MLLLHEELAAALPGFSGISTRPGVVMAVFESEPSPADLATMEALVAAHDPISKSQLELDAEERARIKAEVIGEKAQQILTRLDVGLAANNMDQVNLDAVTNLAAAKVILGRMLAREQANIELWQLIIDYLRKNITT